MVLSQFVQQMAVYYLIDNKWSVYCSVHWCPSFIMYLCHGYLIATFKIYYTVYQPIYWAFKFSYSLLTASASTPKIPYQSGLSVNRPWSLICFHLQVSFFSKSQPVLSVLSEWWLFFGMILLCGLSHHLSAWRAVSLLLCIVLDC